MHILICEFNLTIFAEQLVTVTGVSAFVIPFGQVETPCLMRWQLVRFNWLAQRQLIVMRTEI